MPRPLDHDALWRLFRRRLLLEGPTAAGEARRSLGISQPTFSRLVAARRAELLSVGRGPAVRYAARRPIPGLPPSFPLYELGERGSRLLGILHPVAPDGFYVESTAPIEGFYPGLPWFLDDLRPSGFLGRLVPTLHPDLGFPRDVLAWTIDQVAVWLHGHGADLVGNLAVGEPAFARTLTAEPIHPVHTAFRSERYPVLARDVMAAGVPGSSAAGEQPKFLATRLDEGGQTPVLVKFSPPRRDDVSRRTADLLWCEHVALETIREAGVAAARSEVLRGGDRVFLEVERFDRTPAGGRRGLVSFRALDAAFVGEPLGWSHVAVALHAQGRLDAAMLDRAVWLDRFGSWIGNTDRHLGNLSVAFEGGVLGGLSPAYDMLPMAWAPRSGELPDVELRLPTLTPARRDLWEGSWRAATAFWARVAAHPEVTPDFREIAARNARTLAACEGALARLPEGVPLTR